MSVFVIGDIHGCYEELQELLDQISPTNTDTLVFIGDLIHKGPQSKEVLEYISILQNYTNVILVTGNHEEKQYRHFLNPHRLKFSENNKKSYYDEINDLLLEYPEYLPLIENSLSSYTVEGFLCIHGGVARNTEIASVKLIDLHTMSDKRRKDAIKTGFWTRYITPAGMPVSLGDEGLEDAYWADKSTGLSYPVIFGHQHFSHAQEPVQFYVEDHFGNKKLNAIGIDLGCVYGNRLAAVQIVAGKIINTFTQKAKKVYYISEHSRVKSPNV